MIDLGGDFLKLMAVGGCPVTDAGSGTFGYIAGVTAGGAEGNGRSVVVLDFVQNFFHMQYVSSTPKASVKIIISGEEKIQCLD